jgi:elongation factor P
MQVVLKGVKDGTKMDERFRAGESVERVRLDEAVYQFLFEEHDLLTLMDQATYEQVTVPKELLGEPGVFLQEGMLLTVSSFDEEIVSVTLPDTVVMEVVEADPVVKGQTASASYKPARLENGARVMVPPHIGTGTRIIVNTQDSTYVERAK